MIQQRHGESIFIRPLSGEVPQHSMRMDNHLDDFAVPIESDLLGLGYTTENTPDSILKSVENGMRVAALRDALEAKEAALYVEFAGVDKAKRGCDEIEACITKLRADRIEPQRQFDETKANYDQVSTYITELEQQNKKHMAECDELNSTIREWKGETPSANERLIVIKQNTPRPQDDQRIIITGVDEVIKPMPQQRPHNPDELGVRISKAQTRAYELAMEIGANNERIKTASVPLAELARKMDDIRNGELKRIDDELHAVAGTLTKLEESLLADYELVDDAPKQQPEATAVTDEYAVPAEPRSQPKRWRFGRKR